jgi:uncharacterized protein (DUF488 family)
MYKGVPMRLGRKGKEMMSGARSHRATLFTIGHSVRPLEDFVGLLQENGVKTLIDVRTVPKSRHNPQYDGGSLKRSLEDSGIRYLSMKGLGGLRKPDAKSEKNLGWRNESFRGFADYMQTQEFRESLESLINDASGSPMAIMCAEAVPWRCHRSLIADALTLRGINMFHIMNSGAPRRHTITKFAKARGTRITYPAPKDEED